MWQLLKNDVLIFIDIHIKRYGWADYLVFIMDLHRKKSLASLCENNDIRISNQNCLLECEKFERSCITQWSWSPIYGNI